MSYSSTTEIFVRVMMNGSWTVAGVILLWVIVGYLRRNWHRRWQDEGFQFGAALAVLMAGHLVRSVASWGEFLHFIAMNERSILSSWEPFMIAALIAVTGKFMCMYLLMQRKERGAHLIIAAAAAILIPFASWLMARNVGM